MERGNVNPWGWQNGFGFSQAVTVTGAERVVYCAGQAAVDADGTPVHAGDMRAQVDQSFDNLETVLAAAGLSLANVVRLCYYTTDIDALLANYDAITNRLARAGIQPASTLLGVTRLAFPDNLIEIEATAVA
jgi:enamine deaminase RidA (YjgF/YER057c/UK114 family)